MNIFKKYSKWAAAFIFAVAVITVYKTYDNLSNITKFIGVIFSAMAPFFWGFILAYILNLPAVKIRGLLTKTKSKYINEHSHGISIILAYLLALGIVTWFVSSLIPMIYKNIIDLYNNIPTYLDIIMRYINNLEIIQKLFHGQLMGDNIRNAAYGIFNSVDITEFKKYAQGVFDITSGLISVFIAVIASVYMLLDKSRISANIIRIIGILWDEETAVSIKSYASNINKIFTSFIYSRLICSIVMAVVCSLVLSLLRVKYAIVLGIFIGAMDMIPYFGSIISSTLASIITVLTGGLFKGLYTAAILLVLQQLDGNLLAPKIMENSLEIRPLWIIFAVSVGGTLFGFMGMLLSVPILAILRSVGSDFLEHKKAKQELKEQQ